MVRFTSVLVAIVAGSIGFAAAQSYEDFTLDPAVLPTFAARARGINVRSGDIAAAKTACNALATCLGVICKSGSNTCVPFSYDAEGVLNPGSTGWDSIHFRYNTPSGPTCRPLLGDEFTDATGQCDCGSGLEEQNTGYGCRLLVTPSQLVQRRRIANSRIMPGHAQRAVYERRRTRMESGNAFL